jgi:hypothetical protein
MVRGTKSSNIRARALNKGMHGKNRGKRHQRQSPSIDEGGSGAALVIWFGYQLGQSMTATTIVTTLPCGATSDSLLSCPCPLRTLRGVRCS